MDIEELKFNKRVTNFVMYKYWKEKCGLVTKKYAMKVLEIGEHRFNKIEKEYKLTVEEHRSPYGWWKTKLYKLNEIYKIKDTMRS